MNAALICRPNLKMLGIQLVSSDDQNSSLCSPRMSESSPDRLRLIRLPTWRAPLRKSELVSDIRNNKSVKNPFPFFLSFCFLSSASPFDPSDNLPLLASSSHPRMTDTVYQDTIWRLRLKNMPPTAEILSNFPFKNYKMTQFLRLNMS